MAVRVVSSLVTFGKRPDGSPRTAEEIRAHDFDKLVLSPRQTFDACYTDSPLQVSAQAHASDVVSTIQRMATLTGRDQARGATRLTAMVRPSL